MELTLNFVSANHSSSIHERFSQYQSIRTLHWHAQAVRNGSPYISVHRVSTWRTVQVDVRSPSSSSGRAGSARMRTRFGACERLELTGVHCRDAFELCGEPLPPPATTEDACRDEPASLLYFRPATSGGSSKSSCCRVSKSKTGKWLASPVSTESMVSSPTQKILS